MKKTMTMVLAIIAIAIIGVSTVSAQDRMTPNDERDFKFNASDGSITGYVGKDSRVVVPQKIGGKDVLQIGEGAFKGSNVVREVVIPETCHMIGKEAFMKSGLRSITIQSNLVSLGEGAYQETKDLHAFLGNWSSRITKIPAYLYRYSGLTGELKIPNGVTEIGSYAFANTGITSVTLPSSIKIIGDNAFSDCKTLTKVNFPEGLTQIGKSAFSNTGMNSLVLPSSLKSIGDSAFSGCKSLAVKVNIPQGVTDIGSSAFSSSAITDITLPSSLKALGNSAFSGCQSLAVRVNIPEGVTDIGSNAFDGSAITGVALPSTIKSIGTRAFQQCKALATVTVPSSVSEIKFGNYVFYNTITLSTESKMNLQALGYTGSQRTF